MTIELTLRTNEQGEVFAHLGEERLAGPTPLAALPKVPTLRADPFTHGRALYDALGGEALRRRLDGDGDGLLLLDADDAAQAAPWEFATTPDREYLACLYGVLRLVDSDAPPPQPGPA